MKLSIVLIMSLMTVSCQSKLRILLDSGFDEERVSISIIENSQNKVIISDSLMKGNDITGLSYGTDIIIDRRKENQLLINYDSISYTIEIKDQKSMYCTFFDKELKPNIYCRPLKKGESFW